MNDTTAPITTEATVSDYFSLLKPKVMSLVVFSGFAGLWVAPGAADLHPVLIMTAMLCLAINAGAAGAINMWYDRDIDAVMKRTKNRALPRFKIHPDEALAFGVVLSVLSVMMMGVALNWIPPHCSPSPICFTCLSTPFGSNAARHKILSLAAPPVPSRR